MEQKWALFTKKNKQIMKKLYIRAGDLREGILKIDHWGKPSRERMGTLGSPSESSSLEMRKRWKGHMMSQVSRHVLKFKIQREEFEEPRPEKTWDKRKGTWRHFKFIYLEEESILLLEKGLMRKNHYQDRITFEMSLLKSWK